MEEKIIAKIAELSEVDNITKDSTIDVLKEGYWDSLAVISYMVFAKSELNVQFESADILENVKTVGDICKMTIERMK